MRWFKRKPPTCETCGHAMEGYYAMLDAWVWRCDRPECLAWRAAMSQRAREEQAALVEKATTILKRGGSYREME